jgi:tryptophan-rich sensory protein
MKNSSYIIAVLLIVLWGIITFGFKEFRFANLLLPLAAFIVLLRFFYSKKAAK